MADDAIKLPKWWSDMNEEKQELYLRLHPNSKMQKVASDKIRKRLAKNPKERVKLRSLIKAIAKNPGKALKGDLAKIKEAAANVPETAKKKIDKQVKDALKKKSPKRMLKAIVTGLAVAGALTIGSAVMSAGGLPYAIIGARLFGDGKHAIQEIYSRIRDGESAVKAVFGTISNTVHRASRDPRMLAAALMLQNSKKNDDDGKTKVHKPKDTERTPAKRQNAPKPSKKKGLA